MEVTSEHVATAGELVIAFLEPLASRDWSAPIPDLVWNCQRTMQHLINTQVFYAMLIASRATQSIPYARGPAAADGLQPAELLKELRGTTALIAAVLRGAPSDARFVFSEQLADRTGFAAVACDELLIHGWDIGRGLSASFTAPDELTNLILGRLFPWAPSQAAPWSVFLWCNGRAAGPDRARLQPEWPRWVAPLDEWDGSDPTAG